MNSTNPLAEKIKYTSWGLCGIADTLGRNMLAKELNDFGPPLDLNTESHLITAFQVLAHQLNTDTENLEQYDFIKRETQQ